MEVNLTDVELKDIAASGALASSSWSEIVLKLSIVGIELTHDVFVFFLASFLLKTENNIYKLMLDELKTSDSLDSFFKDTTTLCLIYNMKCIQSQAFDSHVFSKILQVYADAESLVSPIAKEKEDLAYRATKFFSVIAQKFPETVWIFYCNNKQTLWKEDYKFCTSLLHYFLQLVQANDSRCYFKVMCNMIAADQYAMLNTNAFMN